MATQRKITKQKKNEPKQIGDLPKERLESYLSTYSNYVEIGHTPWDFRIVFYEITENATGELVRAQRSKVVVAPQQAKALLNALDENVRKWEERFGSLESPQEEEGDKESPPSKQLH